ncbi:MAG: archaeosortase/exosortase family protein [Pseudomonadota bacterium]
MKVIPYPLLMGAMCIALWPVWIWFAAGSADASNDFSGLLAAATVIVVLWRAPAARPLSHPLALPAALLALYALGAAAGISPSAGAVLAALALAALASAWRLGRRMDGALLALCMLSLPLAATLQFYCGYPLRVVAGNLSAALLRMNGIAVMREGATLAWDGQLIAIDAPCSGIKMLWAGLYLACALAASHRLPAARTIAAAAMACLVVVLANALRAAALFYIESGLVILPPWAHQGVGVVCFIAAALGIFMGVTLMQEKT